MIDQGALLIRIEGLVQGVGFRPFVFRLAGKYGLNGWIVNRNDAVWIKIEGEAGKLPLFVEAIEQEAPAAAQIEKITVDNDMPESFTDFTILSSQDLSDETSEISPDIAVCPECLADLRQQPHRIDYPFINCTNCGPRFSIIQDFPYDREKTTMSSFVMCAQCHSEYEDIGDRRFHAQPVACNQCGPRYILSIAGGSLTAFPEILETVANLVGKGKIIAVKGIGGYHLMCDALNPAAIDRLRKIKRREGKPFAVMFRDLPAIREYARVSAEEAAMLQSWKRPVVVLEKYTEMAEGICLGLNTIGAFLPYMPFHHMLFDHLQTPAIVLTSGNFSDEPIVIDNDIALREFSPVTDAVLSYDREIFNRTDDSVTRCIAGRERITRRSRGYVPSPVKVTADVSGIIATGAELSNCFCIGKGNQAILSQHIGDLKNMETYEFYCETIERFKKMYRMKFRLVAADMHPDYLSARYGNGLGLDIVRVQHHHAHMAACMAEYGLDEQVIGVCMDGTGYGTDGNIWGSEFLIGGLDDFSRYAHFDYLQLPGGDKATHETWRTGLSILHKLYGIDLMNLDIPFVRNLDKEKALMVMEALGKNINTPLSCGCGRYFDGIAAITGLCTSATFHAEAPMRLESVLARGTDDHYDCSIQSAICFDDVFRQIVNDLNKDIPVSVISARFHNSIIWSIFETVQKMRKETGITRVVLTGGSFQNRYLAERMINLLEGNGLEVFLPARVPCNDGGIALGQLMVAARRREKGIY
jgi:hydrogenase maturation protein HypF